MEAVVTRAPQRRGAMRSYRAYGLNLRCSLPLPAARWEQGSTDVEVRRSALAALTAELHERGLGSRVVGDEIHLRLPGVATFVVRRGCEILVDPHPAAGEHMLARALVGPVMAALLQQRGTLVLHASAVRMDGAAVAFLGGCGAGKSTIAAALHRVGHGFLADDVVAVPVNGSKPRVHPGVPQLKLWPESVVALGGDPDRYARIDPQFTKRACAVTAGFHADMDVPLACLFVLCRGERLDIEPLTPSEAFLEIVAHTYGVRWLHALSPVAMFRARTELVRRVPLWRLRLPTKLEDLADVVRRVEESRGSH